MSVPVERAARLIGGRDVRDERTCAVYCMYFDAYRTLLEGVSGHAAE